MEELHLLKEATFPQKNDCPATWNMFRFNPTNITKVNEIKLRWNHNSKYLAKQIARTILRCLNLQKNDCPATWNIFRFNQTTITKVNEIKLRWNHNSNYLAKQIARTIISVPKSTEIQSEVFISSLSLLFSWFHEQYIPRNLEST